LDIALELPDVERAALAHDLLASLDGPADANATKAWEAEIAQRLDDLVSAKTLAIDADEALHGMNARLRPR
jgi:putative addiction module component (TIGR02574 family)